MKSTFLVFLLLIPFTGFSQVCGTTSPAQPIHYTPLNAQQLAAYSNARPTIDVVFYMVRYNNGQRAFPEPNVHSLIGNLNAAFSSHNIRFRHHKTQFINNSKYVQMSYSEVNEISCLGQPSKLNIFIAKSLWSNGSRIVVGRAAGIPSNAFAIHYRYANSSTLPHEAGHCLNLYHTHEINYGVENVPRTGPRANCNTAGDKLCDTPADPKLGLNNVRGCVYYGGDGFTPLVDNYMNYAPANCRDSFTAGQRGRMLTAYANGALNVSCSFTLNGPSSICANQTQVYTLDIPGGSNVQWSVSGPLRIISQNSTQITLQGLSSSGSDNATLTAQLVNGQNLVKNLKVSPLPKVIENHNPGGEEPAPFCVSRYWSPENAIRLNVEHADEGSIQIQKVTTNFDYILQGQELLLRPFRKGPLVFRVKGSNVCGDSDWYPIQRQVIDCSEGVYWFRLVPNPTRSNFQLKAEQPIAYASLQQLRFSVYDLAGNLRQQGRFAPGELIPIQQLPRGVYLVKINTIAHTETHTMVVE